MTADHLRFTDWDAAYLLGALSPADRALYESHVAECERCRTAIAELAPTLGLLARVDQGRGRTLLHSADDAQDDGPDGGHRARVISLGAARARAQRRRRRVASVAAAAAIVIAAVAIPVTASLLRPSPETVALEQVADLPLSASVELTDVAWGTRIEMSCEYGEIADAPAEGWAYALVVIGDDGAESVLSTWRAHPGSTAKVSAGTALAAADIDSLEIRAVLSGDVLMRADGGALGGD
ncbi:zf-HC2 domain-containing protein [Microbacterium sp. SD291]|uniref:zf-HC2 domain-containing protein n=1 Tax=Microbacterium sp. SD291 TaxID=2782007 RepID=UPI001A9664E7|nr:zf-HC2 domain-containing protein [Microbacterium sp. SD291]MBO0979298.1 zf-HC2 domain-containing protein [Microbacterium sp. SD291]